MNDRPREMPPNPKRKTPFAAFILGIIGAGLVIHGFSDDPANSMEYCGGFIVVGLALILEIASR